MVDFGGWDMPVQYPAGILAEHQHTRTAVSVFDCSHMGEFRVCGPRAAADLDRLLPRRVSPQAPGVGRYNLLLTEQGTVLDDLIVFRLSADTFYLVVNAATTPTDAAWIRAHLSPDTTFADESAATAKFDVQGPQAPAVLAALGAPPAELPRYFHCRDFALAGVPCLVSRTGYTGERGFELYVPVADALTIWRRLLAFPTLCPAGLGARDTLRLEMGYPLYGHELNPDTTPAEAGLGWVVEPAHEFIGRAGALAPPRRALVGIRLDSRRAARAGCRVLAADGSALGVVTSGSLAPTLGVAVALATCRPDVVAPGTPVVVELGSARLPGVIASLPFHDKGTVRA